MIYFGAHKNYCLFADITDCINLINAPCTSAIRSSCALTFSMVWLVFANASRLSARYALISASLELPPDNEEAIAFNPSETPLNLPSNEWPRIAIPSPGVKGLVSNFSFFACLSSSSEEESEIVASKSAEKIHQLPLLKKNRNLSSSKNMVE